MERNLMDKAVFLCRFFNAQLIPLSIVVDNGHMTAKDEEGNVIFSQENMETGRYEAPVSEKYVVRVTAEEHKGSFYIGD